MNENMLAKTMIEIDGKEISLEALVEAYRANGKEKPKELAEDYDSVEHAYIPNTVTSFKQLRAAQEAEGKACSIKQVTADFQRLVQNVLWHDEVVNKVAALQQLLGELETELAASMKEADTLAEPYPNEHAVRLNAPGKYKRIRRQNDKFGAGIDAIFGVKEDNTTELQAIRFDASKFTVAQVRSWLDEHEYKGTIEKATGEAEPSVEPDFAEVIRKEGSEIILYTKDGSKVLQRFLFGQGKKYKDEITAREAAKKREGQIQFLKHQEDEVKLMDDVMAKATALKESLETVLETEERASDEGALADEVEIEETAPAKHEIFREGGDPVGFQFSTPVTITEVMDDKAADPEDPISLNAVLIQEGWGNPKDNRYYPGEVLARDGHVFEGAKMHLTDHREDQRSVSTEVSFVEKVLGFEPDRGLKAKITVYDPYQARKVRNLNRIGKLDLIELSILGEGTTRKGKVGDRKGNIVESIDKGQFVDWVTRAGAGGHAVGLAESASEVKHMQKDKVKEILDATKLDQKARDYLAETEWDSEEALNKGIDRFVEAVKAQTGAGEPFGGGGQTEPIGKRTLAEHSAALDAIDKELGW